jgi:hypothetical protein
MLRGERRSIRRRSDRCAGPDGSSENIFGELGVMRLRKAVLWSSASMALHPKARQLAGSGRVGTRRPVVPVPRPPHSWQTNPRRGNRCLAGRPQCQPHQGQQAIHNPQCTNCTQAPLPFNLTESGDYLEERAKETTRYGKYTGIQYARFADNLVILIDAHALRNHRRPRAAELGAFEPNRNHWSVAFLRRGVAYLPVRLSCPA